MRWPRRRGSRSGTYTCSGTRSRPGTCAGGGDLILLQQTLGHSSLAMITHTYQHLTLADAHDELMRLLATDQR